MTLNDLYDLAKRENIPDWWLRRLAAYRRKYPRRSAAQFFRESKDDISLLEAFIFLLDWGRGYSAPTNYALRVEIFGQPWAGEATTAQLSAALARAFEEE